MTIYGRYVGGDADYRYLWRGEAAVANPPDATGTASPFIAATAQQSAVTTNYPNVIPRRVRD